MAYFTLFFSLQCEDKWNWLDLVWIGTIFRVALSRDDGVQNNITLLLRVFWAKLTISIFSSLDCICARIAVSTQISWTNTMNIVIFPFCLIMEFEWYRCLFLVWLVFRDLIVYIVSMIYFVFRFCNDWKQVTDIILLGSICINKVQFECLPGIFFLCCCYFNFGCSTNLNDFVVDSNSFFASFICKCYAFALTCNFVCGAMKLCEHLPHF